MAHWLRAGGLAATCAKPAIVLEQAGGRYLYLTHEGAVVITREGQVVTAWTQGEFTSTISQVLRSMGAP